MIIISYQNILMEDLGTYTLKQGEPPIPQDDDFNITEAIAYMQRGLSATYDYSDFVYVINDPIDPKTGIKKSNSL